MASRPVDLLVIGGGINGAGIARDAAMRGLRTAIVDKGDFGGGTSSNSSRLIHGGLRYLETGRLRLVFESSRERRILLSIAPHLVWPQAFVFPIHKGNRISLFKLSSGLALYDLLALFRNVRPHRMLGKQGVLRVEPNLRSRDLAGAGLYYDARCNDARLTIATVRSAHDHGALAANYVVVDDLERADGRITGARVTDRVNGTSHVIHAHVIVNATGPWSDELRRREQETGLLYHTKGVHVAVPQERLGNKEAVTLISPIDGRILFIVPWGELSYIGTTDTHEELNADDVRATGKDVIYLLRSVNALFPRARLTPHDVVSTWAGVRPLVHSPKANKPAAIPREHLIKEGPTGLISVLGGKLTTYREISAQVVDKVAARLKELDGRQVGRRPPTDKEPLPGGEVKDLDVLVRDVVGEGYSRETAEYLVRCCGTETAAVIRLAQSEPRMAEPIVGGHPAIKAQMVHALRREMAMTLTDLMMRRTHLFYEVIGHGVPEAPTVVDLASEELGWDAGRKASELAAYLEEIQRSMAFRDELGE